MLVCHKSNVLRLHGLCDSDLSHTYKGPIQTQQQKFCYFFFLEKQGKPLSSSVDVVIYLALKILYQVWKKYKPLTKFITSQNDTENSRI